MFFLVLSSAVLELLLDEWMLDAWDMAQLLPSPPVPASRSAAPSTGKRKRDAAEEKTGAAAAATDEKRVRSTTPHHSSRHASIMHHELHSVQFQHSALFGRSVQHERERNSELGNRNADLARFPLLGSVASSSEWYARCLSASVPRSLQHAHSKQTFELASVLPQMIDRKAAMSRSAERKGRSNSERVHWEGLTSLLVLLCAAPPSRTSRASSSVRSFQRTRSPAPSTTCTR